MVYFYNILYILHVKICPRSALGFVDESPGQFKFQTISKAIYVDYHVLHHKDMNDKGT